MSRCLRNNIRMPWRIRFAPVAASRQQRGFTLIELMVTLAVAVVLLVIAVPSFTNITLSNRLTTTGNDIVSAISTARMEAIKRNANTQLCSNVAASNGTDTLGLACGTHTGAVFVMTGTTTTQIGADMVGIATPLQLSGNMAAVRFSGEGLGHDPTVSSNPPPYLGQIADICTSSISINNHRVIQMTAGSILVTKPDTRTCP